MFANPESIISQVNINKFRRVSFEQVSHYRQCRRFLHNLDFDAIPLTKCSGVEALKSVVKFTPHNFPDVSHLDLADTYYVRTIRDDFPISRGKFRGFTPVQCRFIYEYMASRKVVIGLLSHISHNPDQLSRLLRTFMDYSYYTRSIKEHELINVTRFCVKALHHQLHPDGNLVVDVLWAFCRTQVQREDFVNGPDYTHQCIEYMLESCRKIKYHLQYFFRNTLRGRILGFCPVRACVLSAEDNLTKMNTFLQYGFEPLELNGCRRTAIHLGLKLAQKMRSRGINPTHSPHLHRFYLGDRRRDFIMELFFMIFGTLGPNPDIWVRCSKLFFNSILDPYICRGEITRVVNALCRNVDRPIVIQAFDTFFKDVLVETLTPRTLKHLARYHVRRLLNENFQLPEGIYQLDIPHTLFSYLKLEE